MDRLKEIVSYFLAAMAMLSLLCAVYESMNQRFERLARPAFAQSGETVLAFQ
jgi:hypothetical protein